MRASEITENFAKLADQVREAGGMCVVRMGTLRDYIGAGRLDQGPRSQIRENLDSFGLAAVPNELRRNQEDWVLIYTTHGPLHTIMGALRYPTADSDKRIRHAAQKLAPDTQEELEELRNVIQQVRSLVTPAGSDDDNI